MVTEIFVGLQELFDKYDVTPNGFIHVGAHHGQEVPYYERFVTQENIFLFEPMGEAIEILNRLYPAVHVIGSAVSSFTGSTTFYEVVDGLSGERSSINWPIDMEISEQYDVDVVRLDDLPFLAGNVLVLDCQGSEGQVVEGARGYISEMVDALIVEDATIRYTNQVKMEDIDKALYSLGFKQRETFVHPGNRQVSDVFYTRAHNAF